VRDHMVRAHLGGGRVDRDAEHARLAARGALPPAALGRAHYEQIDESVEELLGRVGNPAFVDPVALTVRGDGWTIEGRAVGLTAEERIQVRPGKLGAKDRVRAWITHLALNAHTGDATVPTTTRLVAMDATLVYPPVADAVMQLAELVEGYRRARGAPLPVFERASYDFVEQEIKLRDPKSRATVEPLTRAWQSFAGSGEWSGPADGDDAYVALCFRGRKPFEHDVDDFERWSRLLWESAIMCGQKEKA
jgi:exodeoxyribonuclease V gamma subunit